MKHLLPFYTIYSWSDIPESKKVELIHLKELAFDYPEAKFHRVCETDDIDIHGCTFHIVGQSVNPATNKPFISSYARATALVSPPNPSDIGNKWIRFSRLCKLPNMDKAGVMLLFNPLIRLAFASNCDGIYGLIRPWLIPYYSQLGFEIVPLMPHHHYDQDDGIMQAAVLRLPSTPMELKELLSQKSPTVRKYGKILFGWLVNTCNQADVSTSGLYNHPLINHQALIKPTERKNVLR